MKEKTSITLSRELLREVDRMAGSKHSRSAVIERLLRSSLRERKRAEMHLRDLERINESADPLNAEAADVLNYQATEE